MQRKPKLKEKLGYLFDLVMAKGTIALVGMLFLITAAVVVIAGIIGVFLNTDQSAGVSIWQSLMHAIDAGTLSGDDTSNVGFLVLMSVVTVCGIFVTSILIGIISTGFEQKLYALRKGTSRVLESGHTVIIGFNDGIYTIISELIEAGENHAKNCIVVLGEEEKEVMEELIKGHIEDLKTTRIICRSGKLTETFLYERASLESSRSVIVNAEDDFSVIKILLALVNYLKAKQAFDSGLHITTMIHNIENLEAAKIAGEGKAEVLYFKDALSRIIAHTCRQPGLSLVLTEFFDFSGDEFYFETFPQLAGKQFGEILNLFECSAVVGLNRGGNVMLNPPMDTVLLADDAVIHLAEDDGASMPSLTAPSVDLSSASGNGTHHGETSNLLVLGYNEYLPNVLTELDNYVSAGTAVTVACAELPCPIADRPYQNLILGTQICDIYHRPTLESLISEGVDTILLLSNMEQDIEESDSKTLLLLIHIRDIEKKREIEYNLISEMRSVSNQKLAKIANVTDFVVGSSITNLIITQVSENRKLSLLFEDLLDADGSELYMKKASRYVKTDVETDFYTITELARQRGEIAIGYKKVAGQGLSIITNPPKKDKVTFTSEDYLILIAQDNA
ncbi:MAG: hypothetical protein ACC608_08040 [Anaerofustis sp.]